MDVRTPNDVLQVLHVLHVQRRCMRWEGALFA